MSWIVPDWSAPERVRAIVTTREGPGTSRTPFDRFTLGLRNGHQDDVRSNRRLLQHALDLPSAPHWLRQVHGTRVLHAGLQQQDAEPEADAAVSRTPGTVLAILSADCLPVLFCADDGSEVAAAHAGWRGLAGGVLEAAVAAMVTPPARLMVWLGPCIAAVSYEVGDEVRGAFIHRDAAAETAFVPTRPGHWLCDLTALARLRLRRAGVRKVTGGGFDTFADNRFHSFRRDGARSGRFSSLIWIAPDAS